MSANLNLGTLRTPNNASLAFAAAVVPGVDVSADITLPDITPSITLLGVAYAAADLLLDDITTTATARYLVNVWRGPSRSTAAPHQCAKPLPVHAASSWRTPARTHVGRGDGWQAAAPLTANLLSRWGLLLAMRAEPLASWAEAAPVAVGYVAINDLLQRQHLYTDGRWREATAAEWSLTGSYRHPARKQAQPASGWQRAQPSERSAQFAYSGHPARRRHSLQLPWGEGREVISMWPRPSTPEPPEPPAPPTAHLLFMCQRGDEAVADLPLGRICIIRHNPRIPARRAYIVRHDIEIVRLPERVAVHASRLQLSLDADSWAWAFSATLLGADALDAVQPDETGAPAVLEVTINGHSWQLLAEDWREERQFGRRGITVTGRGLLALLDAPYVLPSSGTTDSALLLSQLLSAHLPSGEGWALAIASGSPDWLVPAGAWSWAGVSHIQAIHAAARELGYIVTPAKAGRTVQIAPRYPVLPWAFAAAEPDLIVPDAAIIAVQRQQALASGANAVFVHGGEVGGVMARVRRTASAGDRLASTVSSPLVTDIEGARLLGSRVLAASHQQPEVRQIRMPMGGAFALGEIGQLLQVELGGVTHRGIINSVGIELATRDRAVTVHQTLQIGEETANPWRQFNQLLPSEPLLLGEIDSSHSDGTATVVLLGGGVVRVRGSGSTGDAVYVQSGAITGPAPELSHFEIEV